MKERLLRNRDGQTLEEFLAAYHPKDYPHPSVTVDLVVVSLERRRPELLMVRRGNHPCLDCWALPGGFVEPDEFTEDAAARELEEETHVRGLALTEIGLFSGPDRDPRGWTMSCAYAAVAERSKLNVCGDDDAAEAGFPVKVSDDYETVAGWLMDEFDCVPQLGDEFAKDGFTFKVRKVRRRRISELLVTKVEQA